MARITVEDCMNEIDNIFDMILLASKRAKRIAKGADPLVDIENDNTGLTGVTVINNADGIIKQEGAKDGAVFAEFQVNFTLINSGTISSNDGQAVNIKQTTNAIITNNTGGLITAKRNTIN